MWPLDRLTWSVGLPYEAWRKKENPLEEGEKARPEILSAVLKTMVKEVKKVSGAEQDTKLSSFAAELIDRGGDHRYIPAGAFRDEVKKELDNPDSTVYGRRMFGQKDIVIPPQPTTKATVEETIEAIQQNIKNNTIKEAIKYAEDLPFFDNKAVEGKEKKVDELVVQLFTTPSVIQKIPELPSLVKKVVESGVLTNPNVLIKRAEDLIKKSAKTSSQLTTIVEQAKKAAVVKEGLSTSSLPSQDITDEDGESVGSTGGADDSLKALASALRQLSKQTKK